MADARALLDHLLENVGNQDEEVGGQGIPLTKPVFADEPWPRGPIDEHRELGGCEDVLDPLTPFGGEAASSHDLAQTPPVHRVKCFCKVQLQNKGGELALIAALNQLHHIDEVFGYGATSNEACLIQIDQL
jgi:hypothetical protein